jgi:hypothetical protein
MILMAAFAIQATAGHSQTDPADAFAQLQSLAGEWEADLPGFGKMTNSIRLVSNGKAIEETIGSPSDNEVSIYTRDGKRILLTHFCAMTPDGHQATLETIPLDGAQKSLTFVLRAHDVHGQQSLLREMDENRKWQGHGFPAGLRAPLIVVGRRSRPGYARRWSY